VVRLLADVLGLPVAAVTITAGDTSHDKVAEIALSPASLRDILAARARS
jgi:uncharacterized protein YggU (UPF0235/DUF167 family)